MKNYVQPGDVLSLVAPYAVTAGQVLKVGSILGVATADAAQSAPVEAATRGVFVLTKVSAQAWSVGDRIYWDDTTRVCTTSSTGTTLLGVAVAAAANPSSTGVVRLNGTF